MSDDPDNKPQDENPPPVTSDGGEAEEDRLDYVDPEEFENFDEVDSDDVELPEDSFDETKADFEGEHD